MEELNSGRVLGLVRRKGHQLAPTLTILFGETHTSVFPKISGLSPDFVESFVTIAKGSDVPLKVPAFCSGNVIDGGAK